MAAGGWKIFTAGDVLTADDTMDYLQQGVLVFASSGARGSAIAAPAEGQFSYLKDTDATEYYDGAAWTPVAQGGLVHIVTETFSAVSSVSLDNCFTGDYDNYRVLAKIVSSTTAFTGLRLRVSAVDSSASYKTQYLAANGATVGGAYDGSNTRFVFLPSSNGALPVVATVDVLGPAIAASTGVTGTAYAQQKEVLLIGGFHEVATAYDGLSLIASTGTITGTVSVYGYKS